MSGDELNRVRSVLGDTERVALLLDAYQRGRRLTLHPGFTREGEAAVVATGVRAAALPFRASEIRRLIEVLDVITPRSQLNRIAPPLHAALRQALAMAEDYVKANPERIIDRGCRRR